MKKVLFIALLTLAVAAAASCAGGGDGADTLPPVKVIGVNEDEKLSSTLVRDGFSLNIYVTYSEITGYSGTETTVTLPESAAGVPVRKIGENAFKNNGKLEKVVFSKSIRVVDRFAFDGCSALKEAVLNEGLETIEDYAFRNTALRKCDLPGTVASLGKYCFYAADLREVVIPDSVSTVGKYCYYANGNLTSVTFGRRMTGIAENMFYNCSSLVVTEIPENIQKIESYAFRGCVSIGRLEVSDRTASIGDGAFYGCTNVTLVGSEGSAILKYARDNGIACEARAAE
ncbi:MAG: leucine-rich repeat domain-containing protein [Clostridia bacterium]|nr:leucine-rich repeat domain-containing protein [Clostridia bacterium]